MCCNGPGLCYPLNVFCYQVRKYVGVTKVVLTQLSCDIVEHNYAWNQFKLTAIYTKVLKTASIVAFRYDNGCLKIIATSHFAIFENQE